MARPQQSLQNALCGVQTKPSWVVTYMLTAINPYFFTANRSHCFGHLSPFLQNIYHISSLCVGTVCIRILHLSTLDHVCPSRCLDPFLRHLSQHTWTRLNPWLPLQILHGLLMSILPLGIISRQSQVFEWLYDRSAIHPIHFLNTVSDHPKQPCACTIPILALHSAFRGRSD